MNIYIFVIVLFILGIQLGFQPFFRCDPAIIIGPLDLGLGIARFTSVTSINISQKSLYKTSL